jgi:hypothetical protein
VRYRMQVTLERAEKLDGHTARVSTCTMYGRAH